MSNSNQSPSTSEDKLTFTTFPSEEELSIPVSAISEIQRTTANNIVKVSFQGIITVEININKPISCTIGGKVYSDINNIISALDNGNRKEE